jgi:exopolysaccharide/PEP-CTERM locus tyrosine autokinase
MSVIEKALGKARASIASQDAPSTPATTARVDTGATTAKQRALQMPPSRLSANPDVHITDRMYEDLGLRAAPAQDHQRVSEYRHVKRHLLGSIRAGQVNRIILVASALAGEGKSFSAANLAYSLALEPDFSVLLIDADVAKPHLSHSLGLLERKGLMNALVEPDCDVENLILSTDIEGLWVLPAGSSHEHATEHLSSERMRAVLELLQETPNRIIVIDSLPILLTTEARVLAPLAGQVLFVVRAESTPQSAVKHAVEVLGKGTNVKMLLNAVVQTGASRYLGYDYGYSYGYGDPKRKRAELS